MVLEFTVTLLWSVVLQVAWCFFATVGIVLLDVVIFPTLCCTVTFFSIVVLRVAVFSLLAVTFSVLSGLRVGFICIFSSPSDILDMLDSIHRLRYLGSKSCVTS